MSKFKAIIAWLWLLSTYWSSAQEAHNFVTPSQKKVTIYIADSLSAAIKSPLLSSFQDHIKSYDRPKDGDTIWIKSYTSENPPPNTDTRAIAFSDGDQEHTLYINIDRITNTDAYDNGLHERSHLRKMVKVDVPSSLDLIEGIWKITAIKGLKIYIDFWQEEEKEFAKIEEAVAEFLATKINPSRKVGSANYFALGLAMQKMESLWWIDPLYIKDAIDQSDIWYLANAIYPKVPREQQIIKLMTLFQDIRDVGNILPAQDQKTYIQNKVLNILHNKDNL
jgi:hypothetical protein